MDSLHTVLRSIQGNNKAETKSRRDHLDVFREFLNHLDRASKRKVTEKQSKAPKTRAKRGKR
jgi:hypothetical protein